MKKRPKPESGKPLNSTLPLPTQKFPGHPEHDLTGENFSGMVVIGFYGKANDHGTAWVCQCLRCNRYEVRRSQPLKRQRPDRDYFCQECENVISRLRKE